MMSERVSTSTIRGSPHFLDEYSKSTTSILLEQERHSTSLYSRKRALWPWILSTIIFATTTIIQFVQSLPWSHPECAASHDPTELVGSSQHQIKFSGALTWNASGVLVNEHLPGETIWVGDPNPDIDALWDGFEDIWNVLLDGEEADLVRDTTLVYNGYWITGLDVFHQLHCLDTLRRALYPDYYPREASPRTHLLHQEHCVDYLRQVIMCHADTTPVPQKRLPQTNRTGPNFATVHTCGSIDDLVAWARHRNAEARFGTQGRERPKDPTAVVTAEDFFGPSKHQHNAGHTS